MEKTEFIGEVIAMDTDKETITIKFSGGDQAGMMLRHLVTETCNFTAEKLTEQ